MTHGAARLASPELSERILMNIFSNTINSHSIPLNFTAQSWNALINVENGRFCDQQAKTPASCSGGAARSIVRKCLCANDSFSHVQSEEVQKWSIVEADLIGSSSPSEFEALRVGVETHNVRDWDILPQQYISAVGDYMTNGRYFLDSQVAIQQALDYLHNLTLDDDSKNAWVFDIGDTSLCNIPYYKEHHWGGEEYNSTAKGEWEAQERAEALPSTLKLYKALLAKGVSVFFISGKKEKSKAATRNNLLKVGYTGFAGLTLRGASDNGKLQCGVTSLDGLLAIALSSSLTPCIIFAEHSSSSYKRTTLADRAYDFRRCI
eukprot:Gb_19057 [translate_table: standard]